MRFVCQNFKCMMGDCLFPPEAMGMIKGMLVLCTGCGEPMVCKENEHGY